MSNHLGSYIPRIKQEKIKWIETRPENKLGDFASCPQNKFSTNKSKSKNKPLNIDNCKKKVSKEPHLEKV